MITLTVIGRDKSNQRLGYEPVLIYTVEVEEATREQAFAAFVKARSDDLDEVHEEDIEVLFAFPGNVLTVADWRE